MKIGFDARMITHPGIGTYIKGLLPEVVKQSPDDEFVVFGDPVALESIAGSHNVWVKEWTAPIYSIQEQISFPYDKEDLDLVHVPHFNIPALCSTKLVVTVHDLIYILLSNSVRSILAKIYTCFMVGNVLRKAGKVITVSGNTRDDLVRIFGDRHADDIKIIHESAGKRFEKIENKSILEKTRDKYGLAENIILYVGSVKPHKNLSTLIEVRARLAEWGVPHQLVIAGRWDIKEDHLKKSIDGIDVKYIGEVSTEDLISLYNLADVLVHLSFYEGFGLTVLEAMQCATPVVVSETSSLPEVAGEAALAVPPLDVEQIADTVYNVLANKELKGGMIAAGIKRSAQFSWEKAAGETIAVYREVK